MSDEHQHDRNSTKCMREAASIMQFELHDVYHFVYSAIRWLSQYGMVSVFGSDSEGWCVNVESSPERVWEQPDIAVCSGGHSLGEAICGAVHTVNYATTQKVSPQ